MRPTTPALAALIDHLFTALSVADVQLVAEALDSTPCQDDGLLHRSDVVRDFVEVAGYDTTDSDILQRISDKLCGSSAHKWRDWGRVSRFSRPDPSFQSRQAKRGVRP